MSQSSMTCSQTQAKEHVYDRPEIRITRLTPDNKAEIERIQEAAYIDTMNAMGKALDTADAARESALQGFKCGDEDGTLCDRAEKLISRSKQMLAETLGMPLFIAEGVGNASRRFESRRIETMIQQRSAQVDATVTTIRRSIEADGSWKGLSA